MSKYLSPKLVVAEAWDITREYKKELFWYGFIPAFFGLIIGTVYVLYQVTAFKHFFEGEKVDYLDIFSHIWNFVFADGSPTALLIIGAIIVLISYLVIPTFAKGALVFLIEKINKGEDMEKGIQAGFTRFVPIFEFAAIRNSAAPMSFVIEGAFIYRHLTGFFPLLFPLLLIFSLFGLIALFFFAYTPQVIVLQRKGLMHSIGESSRISFTYFTETLSLFFLILLIELRVLLNIVIILFIPVVVVAISGFFATKLLTVIGIILATIAGLILLSLAAFISGTLEIFSSAIWTIAYHRLTPGVDKNTTI